MTTLEIKVNNVTIKRIDAARVEDLSAGLKEFSYTVIYYDFQKGTSDVLIVKHPYTRDDIFGLWAKILRRLS